MALWLSLDLGCLTVPLVPVINFSPTWVIWTSGTFSLYKVVESTAFASLKLPLTFESDMNLESLYRTSSVWPYWAMMFWSEPSVFRRQCPFWMMSMDFSVVVSFLPYSFRTGMPWIPFCYLLALLLGLPWFRGSHSERSCDDLSSWSFDLT